MAGGAPDLLTYGSTILVGFGGGFLPASPIEPFLIGIAIAGKTTLWPLVILAALSQMAAKAIIYHGSGGIGKQLSDRQRAAVERLRDRLAGRPILQTGVVLGSALTGIPPLFVVTIACGFVGLPIARFLIAGLIGRMLRFGILVAMSRQLSA
jgi:membrane protein YqaA with SNARE-associated domain